MTATLEQLDTAPLAMGSDRQTGTLWRDSLVFARRNAEHIRQIPEKLLDVTVQPIMFVLLFAFVFGGAISVDGGNYREYLIGGILVQSLAFGLMGPAVSISTDLAEGVIDRFRSLPAARSAYLVGHFVSEVLAVILAITILITTGLLIGWRTHSDPLHVAQAIVLLIAFASAMIWVGTWIGMKARSADAVQGIVFVVIFPLTFVSNAFVPVQSMPDALQWIASWNPISAIVAAVRVLFGNPTTPVTKEVWPTMHPVAAAWIYTVLILVIAVPAAIRLHRARTTD